MRLFTNPPLRPPPPIAPSNRVPFLIFAHLKIEKLIFGVDAGVINYCFAKDWIDVAIAQDEKITDAEAVDMKSDCLEFHRLVSLRMATHLQLTVSNMNKTTWVATTPFP